MKKIISLIVILLILCGCGNKSEEAIIMDLDRNFGAIINSVKEHRTNNNTEYYSFYLPSDVQELEFSDNYHHLVFEACDFVMNLNVNYVLCDEYFDTKLDDPFSFVSEYTIYQVDNLDSQDNIKFNFCLYKFEEKYLFSLYTNRFNFFGTTNINQVKELVLHLFEITYNSKLDLDKISSTYYLGTVFDYDKPKLNLITQHFQPSGDLMDLLIDKEMAQKVRDNSKQEVKEESSEDNKESQ